MNTTVLETTRIGIDEIKPHPQNPRKGNLEVIKESLEEHGQYRAIVVNQRTNEILAGTHTWRAAQELGWDTVLVHLVDVTPEGARKLLLVDNRSNDLAEYDYEILAPLVEEMMLSGDLRGTGYDAEAVDDIQAGLDNLEIDPEFLGDYAESPEETASRYRAPGEVVPQRQFIVMIAETEAGEFEGYVNLLKRNWGVNEFRGVVREALRRCAAEYTGAVVPEDSEDETVEATSR